MGDAALPGGAQAGERVELLDRGVGAAGQALPRPEASSPLRSPASSSCRYAHVDPSGQAPAEERADMERALAVLDRLGVRPLGYRSPSADLSEATLGLLEEHGFLYDSSLMAEDFRPYRPRIGDRVSREEPLVRGREAALPVQLRPVAGRPVGAEQGARDVARRL